MGTHNHHEHHHEEEQVPAVGDRRRRRRGPGGHGRGRGPGRGGPPGRGRERAKRGAVANGVLLVLAERSPLHGYELIAELEERSGGRWRPSPGSMYPALGRLEEKGLIVGTTAETPDAEGGAKRTYELTDEGREWVARRDPDAPLPWGEGETGPGGGMRPLVAEVISASKQIGRFGTDEQRASAAEVLAKAKSDLYKILAQ